MDSTKEKFDKEIYNINSLSLLNIHELREIGRKIGVPSPTTLTKTKLITYIIQIASGAIEAPARSNYGRPSLNKFNSLDVVSKIKKNLEYEQDLENFKLGSEFHIVSLSAPKKQSSKGCIKQGIFSDGRVRFSDGAEFEVAQELKGKLGLEEGDIVEALIVKDFMKIITVNGIRVSGKLDKIKVFGKTICSGESKEFHFDFEGEGHDEINEIIKNYDSKISILIFSENEYSGTNVHNFRYDSKMNFSQIYKLFIQFLLFCEENAKKNEDLMIIFENKKALENAFAMLDDDVYDRLRESVGDKIEINEKLGNYLLIFYKDEDIIYPV